MKWYNWETMFKSIATKVGDYLHVNAIYFELSGNGRYYHFEILTDAGTAIKINDFIDSFRIVNEEE